MRGKAVPQRVRRRRLVDPGRLRGLMAGAGKLTRGDRMQRITAREQPAPRAAHQPPIAQQIEQPRRQHAFLVCTSSRAHISTARAMPIKNLLLNSRAAQTAKLAGNVYELDASHSP